MIFFRQIKGSFTSKRGQESFNPYSQGNICGNCFFVLCGPAPPSLIGNVTKILYLKIFFWFFLKKVRDIKWKKFIFQIVEVLSRPNTEHSVNGSTARV